VLVRRGACSRRRRRRSHAQHSRELHDPGPCSSWPVEEGAGGRLSSRRGALSAAVAAFFFFGVVGRAGFLAGCCRGAGCGRWSPKWGSGNGRLPAVHGAWADDEGRGTKPRRGRRDELARRDGGRKTAGDASRAPAVFGIEAGRKV